MFSPINNNIRPPEAPPLPVLNTPTVIERVDAAAQPALPTLKEQLQEKLLGMKLNAWVQQAPTMVRENYNIARQRILDFVNSPTNSLELFNLNLLTLPDIFDHPAFLQLRELYLDNRQLQELPDSIRNLSRLRVLEVLENNQLQTLPDSIGALAQLQGLNLSNNQLQTVPDSIMSFPWATGSADHQELGFSISDFRGDEMRSLGQLLERLFLVAGQGKREFPDSLKTEELRSWLSRVFKIGKFENEGERQKVLANKILSYLNLAETNEEFRTVFSKVLDEASTTCGDRVLLSILRLGTQHRLARVELNVAEVSELLKGIWALSLLEDCARNKIPTLRFVDEIEVHLAFPVKLKVRLNLPIDVEDMLYFSCSGVTEEDLQEAEGHVRKMWDNKKAYVDFLIQQPKWLETLKASYPEKYGELEREKESASEGDNPDYRAIDESYKRALKELSEKAL